MYLLSRLLLIVAGMLLFFFSLPAAVLAVQEMFPEKQGLVWAILIGSMIAVAARKKGRRLFTSGGTAAWADTAELQKHHMLDAGTGLILGRVPSEGAPIVQAVKALVSTKLSAKEACRQFFDSLNARKRKQGRVVRLPQAVHAMIVAPTGVGKGVSCIIPFLLTCDESCVVIDFKGENALLTAEQRRRRFGRKHKIIILDPFKVVTQ
jgi:type IV secretion system protein VirD4